MNIEERHEKLEDRVELLEQDKRERDIRWDERCRARRRWRARFQEWGGIIGMAVGLAALTNFLAKWWGG